MVDTDAVFCLSEQLQGILNEIGKKKKDTDNCFKEKRTKVKKNKQYLLLKRRIVIQHKNET